MIQRKPLIAGNWKMNLTVSESVRLVQAISEGMDKRIGADVLVAPPFTLLSEVHRALKGKSILLGAQNIYWEPSGAFTGEVSASMVKEVGCTHVILGHSERRCDFGETDETVNLKVQAAMTEGLIPIVCIGETLDEREKDRAFEVIRSQLDGSLRKFREKKDIPVNLILAYEPVWAIGTGKTASPEQAQEIHRYIRQWLQDNFGESPGSAIRILYGGSVKGDNAKELLSQSDIDGALVGGASLKAESFLSIIQYDEK
jgi:triosephosphate isomerase